MKFREDQMSITSQTRSTAYAVMQRIFEEGFATGDGSVADELCSRDLVDHQFGTAGRVLVCLSFLYLVFR